MSPLSLAAQAEKAKRRLASQGKTQREWAAENNFDYDQVNRVLNGRSKALRGIGHDIAVKLGMKTPETAA